PGRLVLVGLRSESTSQERSVSCQKVAALAAALSVAAVIAAGCGDSTSDSASTAASGSSTGAKASTSKPVSVSFVVAGASDPFFITQKCGAQAAAKQYNVDLWFQG